MATIQMSAQQVIDAANKTIAKIESERNRIDEITIARAMNLVFRFSFRRGFYRMTKDEAIDWLDQQECFGRWGLSIHAWSDLAKAKALLKLAQHGDPVTLNEEDVRVLF